MAEPKEEMPEVVPSNVVEDAARALPDRIEAQVERIEEVAAGQAEAEAAAEANVRAILDQRQRELERRRREFDGEQEIAEAARLKEAAAQAEAAAAAAAAAVRTYTVESGDSLSAIALALYGDMSRWPEIFEANRDQLSNPNLIYVGQILRIP